MRSDAEILFVELEDIDLGVVYKAPQTDRSPFFDDLETVFALLTENNKQAVILGDTNIDILSSSIQEYTDLLDSYGFHNCISTPTRITETSATCIDHILCNFVPACFLSGVYDTATADHLGVGILYRSKNAHQERRINAEYVSRTYFSKATTPLAQYSF